ncbi:oleate hydratase [Marinobacter nanhaiticus D15-8W]|uniref:Oleate hydratase n=1 Tax=Marinobacter nanhaiticus D15-8W TaxID=626887 RepID=N6X2F5_9GAMM|nr:oleate hydratase [Marinobacter nanhaiticus]ENO15218.1 oleate hydratase [Marinobacter nanhaiticus D15-8W]BES69080.1 oleate hydratase [Marinobacter nanhaiticus D15-8W]
MSPQSPRLSPYAYFVGGGIAALAGAAFLIRDAGLPGENIVIMEELPVTGGSMDGAGCPRDGYVIRGGRMLNLSYLCTYALFRSIPSLEEPARSVYEEIMDFNARVKTHAKARLIRDGQILDVSSMSFSAADRIDILNLLTHEEARYYGRRIDDYFSPAFFQTHFWYMWATMFAFQPWHSLLEFKRYMHRFMHEFPRIHTLEGVDRTPYNQYDSMVLPLLTWLEAQGVKIMNHARVTDITFEPTITGKRATAIHYQHGDEAAVQTVGANDRVFITNGSMTEGSSLGGMERPPTLNDKHSGGAWALWEKLADKDPAFGRPKTFTDHPQQSKWESFTITFRDTTFFDRMEAFTGNTAGTGALVTFTDSNWLLSIVLAHQPHFLNQPKDVQVCWGYGLFPDQPGNFIRKPMAECTGEEILRELLCHLQFEDDADTIVQTATCIPCMMPFITSQFLVRDPGDRPQVVPEGATNFAFIGQFTEIPDDVVFTVEYSVRSAQMAVYQLMGLDLEIPPIYHDPHPISETINAAKALMS